MKSSKLWQKIEPLFHRAMNCRECFGNDIAQPALIDIAQPRWIGKKYFNASKKILLVTLNPGAGNTPEKKRSNMQFRQKLYDFRDKKISREDFFRFQKKRIPKWGIPPGRFVKFYFDGMKLKIDEVALMNIAWCADANNKWPSKMLSLCFDLFTKGLIETIQPDIAILSGSGTHKYANKIKKLVPGCKTVCTLHYAHRKGKDKEREELQRVRNEVLEK